jgi:hypothetical protein
MDPIDYIAARFNRIISDVNEMGGRPDSLPEYDRAIFHLLSIRCEIDINGFESVFDQLLTEDELLFSVCVLEQLEFNTLATAFRQAHSILRDSGFYNQRSGIAHENKLPDGSGILDPIEQTVADDGGLWMLDDKLIELIPEEAK